MTTLALVDHALSTEISPEAFRTAVDHAAEKAKVLTDIVERKTLYREIGSHKHLLHEAWQTIGEGYGLSAGTRPFVILRDPDGSIIGVQVDAEIYDTTGTVRGRASQMCLYEEEQWQNKPLFQLAGMAQTRAISRAYRQILSWVVVLAGYNPTPADEMGGTSTSRTMDGPHYCPEHQTAWFRQGKMRGYAHPVDGTQPTEWCNEPVTPPRVKASRESLAHLATAMKAAGCNGEQLRSEVNTRFGFADPRDMTEAELAMMIEWLTKPEPEPSNSIEDLKDAVASAGWPWDRWQTLYLGTVVTDFLANGHTIEECWQLVPTTPPEHAKS